MEDAKALVANGCFAVAEGAYKKTYKSGSIQKFDLFIGLFYLFHPFQSDFRFSLQGIDVALLKEVKEVKRARLTEYAAARKSAEYHEGKGVVLAKEPP